MTTTLESPPLAEREQRVTALELFFDLVFVFAITQVTTLMGHEPTWRGLLRGVLVLSTLWWAWAAYSWLTNTIDPEEGSTRLAMLAAMAATLVASLAVPHAFGDEALTFAAAYTALRVLHVVVYLRAAPDGDVRRAIARMAPGFLVFCGLLFAAAACHGWLRDGLWLLALALHVAGLSLSGVEGWRVSPAHFAERHSLIVIIALGEEIVSVGVGASARPLTLELLAAAVLGVIAAFALWWAYFDVVAPVAGRRLQAAQGAERARMARDSYTYGHLPMVAGIVLLAFGVKRTMTDTGAPLSTVVAAALCGGAALYLLAHVAFRLRNLRTWNRQRLVVAVVCLALIPVGTTAPALLTLALVTAALCGLIAYEAIRFADARVRVRHAPR